MILRKHWELSAGRSWESGSESPLLQPLHAGGWLEVDSSEDFKRSRADGLYVLANGK